MGWDRVQVDRVTFERLINATIGGDIVAARAAIDEMALVHDGGGQVGRFVQLARKRERGIVDKDVAPFPLPVPGHLRGSVLGKPRLAPDDKIDSAAAMAGFRA